MFDDHLSMPLVRVGDFAHARSGDKGNRANIGVVANDASCYAWLKDVLTEEVVAEFFGRSGLARSCGMSSPSFTPSTLSWRTRWRRCEPFALNRLARQAAGSGVARDEAARTRGREGGTMNPPTILRNDQGPVVILTLNRPHRRNALSRDLVAELSDHLTKLEAEHGVRAVVLTGAEPVFCAGMDLKESLLAGETDEAEKQAIADVQGIADLVDQVHRLSKPTIAALNGDAFAGGAGLALACDFVIAAEHARLGYPEVRRGLVAAVVMHDLVRQVGERRRAPATRPASRYRPPRPSGGDSINRVVEPGSCLTRAVELGSSLLPLAPRRWRPPNA